MGLYLGSTQIRAVNTNYQTTTYNTNDATVTNGSEIIRGYTAYSKGAKYTGTAPKVFLAATAPTSGMQSGDLWVKTSGISRKEGPYTAEIPAVTSTGANFTEWYNYATYTRTSSCTASAAITGDVSGGAITTSYTLSFSCIDPGTQYSDYNYTVYYHLEFVGTSTTYTVVNSSTTLTHGGTGTITGNVTVNATTEGYFRLTIYYTLQYYDSLSTTATLTSPSVSQQSGTVGVIYPPVPNTTGVYMNESKVYNGKVWV